MQRSRDRSQRPSSACLVAAAVLWPLFVLLACAAPPARSSSTAGVLAAARAALGWELLLERGGTVAVTGRAERLGIEGREALQFDSGGRVRRVFEGPLSEASGHDGARRWERDWNHTPRVLSGQDEVQAEVVELLLTGRWSAASDRLQLTLREEDTSGLVHVDFVHRHADVSGSVALTAATLLPTAAVFGSGDDRSEWTFADWRTSDGIAFPGRLAVAEAGQVRRLWTESVTLRAEPDAAAFEAPLELPADTRFDRGLPAALEVRRAPSGHLLVRPTLEGEDRGWFIFDSGAGTQCIHVGATHGLQPAFGRIVANGIGGRAEARFRPVRELRLGPLTLTDTHFIELELGFLSEHFGVPIGGILGYELLARCTASVDMARARIELHDPRGFRLPPEGTWTPVHLSSRRPCVEGEVEGHRGAFLIDTGAADDTVTFHFHAVHDLGLLQGRETTPGRAGGVGGSVATRTGRLASFELGGQRFEDLPAAFTLEDKGAFAIADVWGNIGGRLLEPFVLVFDYQNNRVGFVPR